MRIRIRRPVNPVIFRNLQNGGCVPVRIEQEGAAASRFLAVSLTGETPHVELVGATRIDVGVRGVLIRHDSDFGFESDLERALRFDSEIRDRAELDTQAAQRLSNIRTSHPIALVDGESPIETLVEIQRRRYAIYRTGFASLKVDGTVEAVSEVSEAIFTWGRAVVDALPFATKCIVGINSFRGGNSNGSAHISLALPISNGRLHREAGDLLCMHLRKLRFWDNSDGPPNCPKCISIAERLIV